MSSRDFNNAKGVASGPLAGQVSKSAGSSLLLYLSELPSISGRTSTRLTQVFQHFAFFEQSGIGEQRRVVQQRFVNVRARRAVGNGVAGVVNDCGCSFGFEHIVDELVRQRFVSRTGWEYRKNR